MNLFFLDIDPKKCAEQHCNKHLVKMILELTQILYTTHRILKTKDLPPDAYQIFSSHHPTCIWNRQCATNYNYTTEVAKYLCEEYTFRYSKVHKCEKHIDWLKSNLPTFITNDNPYINCKKPVVLSYNKKFQELGHTPVPLAMPDDVKFTDTFKSYRFYYIVYKRTFAKWKDRLEPWWYTSGNYQLIN